MSSPFVFAAARASVSLVALLSAGALFAQQGGGQPAEGTAEADDIVVVGLRPIAESEAAALSFQRASPSLVSVVAADAIGRLPDQNIAEAIGRLPGIGVEKDQGQARYISIRGAPNRWSTLSFDGINVVSPGGRETRFDSIPAAIASKVVVNKAITPAMPGETIAGNVDVITRSAFDYPGLHLQARASYGISDLGDKPEYEGTLVLARAWNVGGGEIGVVFSGSYYQRDMITDNFETDWELVSRDRRPDGPTPPRFWARETENKFYRLTRKNWSVSGRLEWRPNPDNRFSFSSIYTIFTDDEERWNAIFDLDDQESRLSNSTAPCPQPINPVPLNGSTGYADVCTGNAPFLGTVYGIDIGFNTRSTRAKQSIFTNTLGADHDIDDRWKLAWRLNYTRSVDDGFRPAILNYESPNFANAVQRPTVFYDLTDRNLAKVELFRTLRGGDGNFRRGDRVTRIEDFAQPLTRIRDRELENITDAYTARFDLSHELPFLGGETTLTFGGRFDQRTKESNESGIDANAAFIIANNIPRDVGFIADSTPYEGKLPVGYTFNFYDPNKAIELVNLARAAGAQPIVNRNNFYNVREQVFAGYVMGITRYDWGNILYGARLEHVKNRGRGLTNIGGTFTELETESSSTLVFPSLHANFNMTDDIKLRFTVSTGAARADYPLYRPNFTFDDTAQTVSGGNPNLKPEKVWGFDAYLEWYLQPRGFFSVGVFYKDARDVLFTGSTVFDSDVLNFGGTDRSQYVLLSTINGGSGYIMGAEAAFLAQVGAFTGGNGFLDSFGIQANVNWNTSRATAPDGSRVRFPGTSEWVWNVGPYFENYGVSARLAYQFRSAQLDGFGNDSTAGDIYWAARDSLDFSIRYAFTRQFEVFFDAKNLLNSPGRRFAGDNERTTEFELFGRRYAGGVRFTY